MTRTGVPQRAPHHLCEAASGCVPTAGWLVHVVSGGILQKPVPPSSWGSYAGGFPRRPQCGHLGGHRTGHRDETVTWNGPHSSPLRILSLKVVCNTAGSRCIFQTAAVVRRAVWGLQGRREGPRAAHAPPCRRDSAGNSCSPGKPCCLEMSILYRKTQKTNHFISNRVMEPH